MPHWLSFLFVFVDHACGSGRMVSLTIVSHTFVVRLTHCECCACVDLGTQHTHEFPKDEHR